MSNEVVTPTAYIKTLTENGAQVFPRTKYNAVYNSEGTETLATKLEEIDDSINSFNNLDASVTSLNTVIQSMRTISDTQIDTTAKNVTVTFNYHSIGDNTPSSTTFTIPSGNDFSLDGVVTLYANLPGTDVATLGSVYAVTQGTAEYPAGMYRFNGVAWQYIGAVGTGIKEIEVINDYFLTQDEKAQEGKTYYIRTPHPLQEGLFLYVEAPVIANETVVKDIYYEAPTYGLKITYDNEAVQMTDSVQGRGITSLDFVNRNELQVTYTDGKVENLGPAGVEDMEIKEGNLYVKYRDDNDEATDDYQDLGRVLGLGIKEISVVNDYFLTQDETAQEGKTYYIRIPSQEGFLYAVVPVVANETIVKDIYYEAPTYGLKITYDDNTTVQYTDSVKGRDIADAYLEGGILKIKYSDDVIDEVGNILHPLVVTNAPTAADIQSATNGTTISTALSFNQLDSNEVVANAVMINLSGGLQAYFNCQYIETSDLEPVEGKKYYRNEGNAYVLIPEPTELDFHDHLFEKTITLHLANTISKDENGINLGAPSPGALASYALGEEAGEDLTTNVWRPVYIEHYSDTDNINYGLTINNKPELAAGATATNSLFTINYVNTTRSWNAVPADAEFDTSKTYYTYDGTSYTEAVGLTEFAAGVTYYTYTISAATPETLLTSTVEQGFNPDKAESYPMLKMTLKGQMVYENAADYAEYFEWADGNPAVEDRRGLFVSFADDNSEQIQLATHESDVIGIVSANPNIVGNAAEFEWNKKYLRNAFGDVLTDANGELILNPEYDETLIYTPRSKRSEWAIIGLMGQIVVCDDGTCKVGKYCTCGQGGVATAADTGWRVMKRIDENHIKILFK